MSEAGSRDPNLGDRTLPVKDPAGGLGRALQWDSRVVLLVYHPDGVEVLDLDRGAAIVIGRSPPAHVRINEPSLSREHASFLLSEGKVIVQDLGSTNGSWVNGQRITRCELGPGDQVVLGRAVVAITALTPADGSLPGSLSYDKLRSTIEDELLRARCFHRHFAVLGVRLPAQDRTHITAWYPQVRALLRPVDRTALYSLDTAVVLLPEATLEASTDLARKIAELRPVAGAPLLVGVAPFPGAATCAEDLLERCLKAVQRATPERPVQTIPLGTWTPSAQPRLGDGTGEPVSASPAMRDIFATVPRLSAASIAVLIQGETGTGKEILARAIHEQGPRREGPMVCVNCGAIPVPLVESVLFGHERGAFTGAVQQQKGVFEAASGGTVFLDEIGELPALAQAALLRVLETSRVTRVGSNKEVEVDVRLVAATHKDLDAMCAAGGFRLDLLYRLNAMTLTIPPLRQRPEDVPPLVERFLKQANQRNGRRIQGLEPRAFELLMRYSWPGNVRELRNAIERAVVIAEGDAITIRDLPERVRTTEGVIEPASHLPGEAEQEGGEQGSAAPSEGDDLKTRLRSYEAELIVRALRDTEWNQTEAAQRLGLPLRTLVHKLKALGIKKLGYEAPGCS